MLRLFPFDPVPARVPGRLPESRESRESPREAIRVPLRVSHPAVPEVCLRQWEQLALGGRLVGPFGARDEQELLRLRRTGRASFGREVIGRCRFVDLVGVHGWVA